METRVSEIADGIFRLSTFVPNIAPPAGFTFNQFLILGDEPLMFHTACGRCLRSIAKRSAVSFRPNAYAGSPSDILRPTSAAP